MRNIQIVIPVFITVFLMFFEGCASFEPLKTTPAHIGAPTEAGKELALLPPPKEPIVAAVYKFRDETGQYKLTSSGSSFSTAVTQGATSILLKALQTSGWFVPIEREGLSDLLNERKIIRSSRENYLGANGQKLPPLPPLLYAGVILEGGIISYETNVLTGGVGVKYFGTSASGQYRQDKVTVYLRAVSTQNGKVLKTVYATKTILSQMVDAGLYQFVDYQKLLQVETGYTYNEPVDLCVTEAIQKAVQSLVIEGIMDGLWQLKNQKDFQSSDILNYLTEKKKVDNEDFLEKNLIHHRPAFGIDLSAGGQIYSGDYPGPTTNFSSGAGLMFSFNRQLSLEARFGRGKLGANYAFSNMFYVFDLASIYRLVPRYELTPYVLVGGSIVYKDKGEKGLYSQNNQSTDSYFAIVSGLGLEYLLSNHLGLNVEINNHYVLSDQLDGLSNGKYDDYYWGGRIGLTIFIGQ